MSRRPEIAKPWRATGDEDGFDELVVGEWLHLERMNDRTWWICLGGKSGFIDLGSDNRSVRLTWTEGEPTASTIPDFRVRRPGRGRKAP